MAPKPEKDSLDDLIKRLLQNHPAEEVKQTDFLSKSFTKLIQMDKDQLLQGPIKCKSEGFTLTKKVSKLIGDTMWSIYMAGGERIYKLFDVRLMKLLRAKQENQTMESIQKLQSEVEEYYSLCRKAHRRPLQGWADKMKPLTELFRFFLA